MCSQPARISFLRRLTFPAFEMAGWAMPNVTDDGCGLEGRLNLTVDVMLAAGMVPRLWPTEFGYQLFLNASGAGWEAHTHAAAVAQSLLLMRGQRAVERFCKNTVFPPLLC